MGFPALQRDSSPAELLGKPQVATSKPHGLSITANSMEAKVQVRTHMASDEGLGSLLWPDCENSVKLLLLTFFLSGQCMRSMAWPTLWSRAQAWMCTYWLWGAWKTPWTGQPMPGTLSQGQPSFHSCLLSIAVDLPTDERSCCCMLVSGDV